MGVARELGYTRILKGKSQLSNNMLFLFSSLLEFTVSCSFFRAQMRTVLSTDPDTSSSLEGVAVGVVMYLSWHLQVIHCTQLTLSLCP